MSEVTLGKFLRNKRESRNVGVRKMARAINITPSYLSDIELDRTNPSIVTLRTIVDFLELDQADKVSLLSDINVYNKHSSPRRYKSVNKEVSPTIAGV